MQGSRKLTSFERFGRLWSFSLNWLSWFFHHERTIYQLVYIIIFRLLPSSSLHQPYMSRHQSSRHCSCVGDLDLLKGDANGDSEGSMHYELNYFSEILMFMLVIETNVFFVLPIDL
ncbi:hypothetical protein GUJ93_ZPchr0011g28426 [Zizania palustris]|uniref:Uncharacterized protein n=1 Tax=Zizania palustris TaxID=103762 RepID=A0A8J6BQ22_ZIZPA|nr:hypothetical protein GUJ93_ZPchr0011g28426 [Zizania palustris]